MENMFLFDYVSWGILGLMLIGLEMLSGTFYVIWFGLSALVVALLSYLFPWFVINYEVSIFVFATLSLALLFFYKRFYESKKDQEFNSNVGQSTGDAVGIVGFITKEIGGLELGEITFTQGVMGSKTWDAVTRGEGKLMVGDSARVIAIEGNSLVVEIIN